MFLLLWNLYSVKLTSLNGTDDEAAVWLDCKDMKLKVPQMQLQTGMPHLVPVHGTMAGNMEGNSSRCSDTQFQVGLAWHRLGRWISVALDVPLGDGWPRCRYRYLQPSLETDHLSSALHFFIKRCLAQTILSSRAAICPYLRSIALKVFEIKPRWATAKGEPSLPDYIPP